MIFGSVRVAPKDELRCVQHIRSIHIQIHVAHRIVYEHYPESGHVARQVDREAGCTICYLKNIAELLNSCPDLILSGGSALFGVELIVRQGARRVWIEQYYDY
jgi:spore coat polysaccharide biosynthesis predicted glycosyltransferase SpsG